MWHDQLVAIKIPTDTQYVRNLQREGAAIHGLVHPNIVRAMGFDPYGDPPYLVMEYVPGMSLRALISEKSLRIPDAVAIMRQVLAGLAHAHKNGIVHRDIKPENILIHERAKTDGFAAEGVVKVTDFGLGRAASKTAVGSIIYSQSMNDDAGKEIAGTLDYMAPEQRTGAETDARADLYACGVVLYEMLTGERPAGTDLPSDLNNTVPRHLDEAFKRSYARLEKRFVSRRMSLRGRWLAPAPPPMPNRPPPRAECGHWYAWQAGAAAQHGLPELPAAGRSERPVLHALRRAACRDGLPMPQVRRVSRRAMTGTASSVEKRWRAE